MRHTLAALACLSLITAGCGARQSVVPAPSDFTVSIHVLTKKCFGSAGCVLTYEVEAGYDGPPLDDDREWTVTYEVAGGQDVATDSFDVRGDRVRYGRRQVIRTVSSAAELSARVLRVR